MRWRTGTNTTQGLGSASFGFRRTFTVVDNDARFGHRGGLCQPCSSSARRLVSCCCQFDHDYGISVCHQQALERRARTQREPPAAALAAPR